MKAVGVIPARLESTRLSQKVLRDICGKPVIQHVYERAREARLLDDVIVACDDERILKVVQGFGGKAVLTSRDHRTGTERLSEVVNELDVEIILNIQGDEPLVKPHVLNELVALMQKDSKIEMGTVVKRTSCFEELQSPDVVKAVVDQAGRVLYFSRSALPGGLKQGDSFYKHIGLYAYTKDFLFVYKSYPPSMLEQKERLEQLRALENGHAIWSIETDTEMVGVDTEKDLERARELMKVELERRTNKL